MLNIFIFLWDLFILQTPPVSASNPIPLSYHPNTFFTLGGYFHCRHFSKSGLCPPPTDRTLSGLNCKTWFQRCHLTGPYSELVKKSGKLTPTQTHTQERNTITGSLFWKKFGFWPAAWLHGYSITRLLLYMQMCSLITSATLFLWVTWLLKHM